MSNMNTEREELLRKAHSLSFYMYLTVLSSENCFEVEVITSRGVSLFYKGCDDFIFDVYLFDEIDSKELKVIKEKILLKSLYYKDLKNTKLKHLAKKLLGSINTQKELSSYFTSLLDLPDGGLKEFYCILTNGSYLFTTDKKKIADILNKEYPINTTWEELDNNQISNYINRIEEQKVEFEFPFSTFD